MFSNKAIRHKRHLVKLITKNCNIKQATIIRELRTHLNGLWNIVHRPSSIIKRYSSKCGFTSRRARTTRTSASWRSDKCDIGTAQSNQEFTAKCRVWFDRAVPTSHLHLAWIYRLNNNDRKKDIQKEKKELKRRSRDHQWEEELRNQEFEAKTKRSVETSKSVIVLKYWTSKPCLPSLIGWLMTLSYVHPCTDVHDLVHFIIEPSKFLQFYCLIFLPFPISIGSAAQLEASITIQNILEMIRQSIKNTSFSYSGYNHACALIGTQGTLPCFNVGGKI